MSSSATPSSITGSMPTSSPPISSVRGKIDPAWGHYTQSISDNKRTIICLYCGKKIKGGGINRFKQHLAGIKGQAEPCKKVSSDVRYQMTQNIEEHATKKRKAQELLAELNPYGPELGNYEEDDEVEEIPATSMPPPCSKGKSISTRESQSKRGKRKAKGIETYFMPRTTHGAERTLKSVLQGKEATEKCSLIISKWMIDASIPFNVANSLYYQQAINAIASMGAGYKGPSFHDLRSFLLTKNVEEVKKFVNGFRTTWKETGCTIMADGWTDQCRRTLINFLVYCPKGIVFLKSVDASDASKTAQLLYKLFREVVLFVGPENVVHMVTDNAANYVAAGRLLEKEFPTLYWSPCAAHCMNLILQDIGKFDEVSSVVNQASKITKYVYNHCYALHLMRKHTGGREILRPALTRFATNFIALQSILSQKDALRAMVVSREWTISTYARESKAKKFVDNVLDQQFWKECATIVHLTEPLVRVLRIVDSDDRPAMSYLYEAVNQARAEMLRRFQRKKKRVDPYIQILDARWDSQLHKNLHAAGYWLNPRYQYTDVEVGTHKHTISGLIDVIERYSNGNEVLRSKLTSEMKLFRNAQGDFGRVSAICDHNVMCHDERWLNYGTHALNLQKLAIRVLSQTCSASGCERNWSIFEHIHSKKRNRLEHQRLNDLVYVYYNVRLRQRNHFEGRNYDPIDFEEFSSNGTWILEEEPSSLTNDELETFRRELAACSIQNNQNDDFLNMEEFEIDDEGDDDDNENANRGEEGNGNTRVDNETNANGTRVEIPDFGID